jgi:hypothetical protein
MAKKHRIERLEAAVARAQAALEGADAADIERAASELLSAMVDAYPRARELGGPELLNRMKARAEEIAIAALQRTLTACPCCQGTELLVSREPVRLPFEVIEPGLDVLLVACRSCGDVRLQSKDPPALAGLREPAGRKYFREVALPAREPVPFR